FGDCDGVLLGTCGGDGGQGPGRGCGKGDQGGDYGPAPLLGKRHVCLLWGTGAPTTIATRLYGTVCREEILGSVPGDGDLAFQEGLVGGEELVEGEVGELLAVHEVADVDVVDD